ncbi:MAG TPA: Beta-galactosidase C-terminal domain, partial [Ardenticatenaceae bacterium]|nr:Beta-galactosidase C-terminal domain [Ardenticatenaceae bacterium]
LAAISGVTVEEYDSPPKGDRHPLAFEVPALAGHSANAAAWADVLAPGSASVVARYTREFYAGRPAITLNETAGGGRVLYVGTLGEAELFDTLAPWVLELAGVTPLLDTPDGVEAAARWQGGQRLLFLLNHTDGEQTVSLDGAYRNLLDGEEVARTLSLPPYGVAILTGA